MSGSAETHPAVAGAARQAARWQRERILDHVAKHGGAEGMTVTRIAFDLAWPRDSAAHWVEELLDLGELAIGEPHATGEARVRVVVIDPATSPQADGAS